MHVEFRCSEVRQACTFDPQSFYRVKQHLYRESTTSTLPELGEKRDPGVPLECLSLYKSRTASKRSLAAQQQQQLQDELQYTPVLQVQFVLEHFIRLRTSEVSASRDRQPHPADDVTGAIGCLVRTRQHSATFWEVLLATLPLDALDGSCKIRLLQMPPPLRTRRARRAVEEALGSATAYDQQMGTPLCIGVGKITLKELLAIRGGVRMALQAKKCVLTVVESLNLSSTSTGSVLGRKDGGSAFITVEVTAFSYGKASLSKMLFFPSAGTPGRAALTAPGAALLAPKSLGEDDGERSTISMGSTGVYESPVTRFFFIPYLAAVDVLLAMHDVLSWRYWLKSGLIISIVLIAIAAEVLPLLVLVLVFGVIARFAASASRLYRTPLGGSSSAVSNPVVATGPQALAPYTYIYGRQNKLLNALVRSQLFYAYGLQEESFYEIAFVFHLMRRRQNTVVWVALLCTLLLLLPSELSFLIVFFCLFVAYPLTLRFTIPRTAKQRRRRLLSLTYLINSWRLNHPMKVTRIIHVGASAMHSAPSSTRGMEPEILVSERGYSSRRNSSSFGGIRRMGDPSSAHGRLASMSIGPNLPAGNYNTVTRRQQTQNAAKLSFAVLTLTTLSTGSGEAIQLLPMLRAHCRRTHLLHQKAMDVATLKAKPGQGVGVGTANTSMTSGVATHSNSGEGFDVMYAGYLRETVQLLSHIRAKTVLQAHVTPTTHMPTMPSSLMRVDDLVRSNWLVEQGEDDGITSTILAMQHYAFRVSPLAEQVGASPEAQALAALAAYLLQGARLSIYTRGRANRNCSIILPLQIGSSRFERYQPLHPRHSPTLNTLLNALEEIWQNTSQQRRSETQNPAPSLTVSQDMVLQIVKTHADMLLGKDDARNHSKGRLHSFAREASQMFPVVPCGFEELSNSATFPGSLHHVRSSSYVSGRTMPGAQSPLMLKPSNKFVVAAERQTREYSYLVPHSRAALRVNSTRGKRNNTGSPVIQLENPMNNNNTHTKICPNQSTSSALNIADGDGNLKRTTHEYSSFPAPHCSTYFSLTQSLAVIHPTYCGSLALFHPSRHGPTPTPYYGPKMVRLAFHDAGSWDCRRKDGAPNSASMRFEPECKYAGNNGLQGVQEALERVKANNPAISYPDLWVLGSYVAIEWMGGPKIQFRWGRKEATSGAECGPDGRLPDAHLTQDHIREVFTRLGLNDQEAVVLCGAHTVGGAHRDVTGFQGNWTDQPAVFDNSFFKVLLERDWVVDKENETLQFKDANTKKLMMMPSDVALRLDPAYRVICERYAADNELFKCDFAAAWKKLTEITTSELYDLPVEANL
eukprot:gene6304-4537_t